MKKLDALQRRQRAAHKYLARARVARALPLWVLQCRTAEGARNLYVTCQADDVEGIRRAILQGSAVEMHPNLRGCYGSSVRTYREADRCKIRRARKGEIETWITYGERWVAHVTSQIDAEIERLR